MEDLALNTVEQFTSSFWSWLVSLPTEVLTVAVLTTIGAGYLKARNLHRRWKVERTLQGSGVSLPAGSKLYGQPERSDVFVQIRNNTDIDITIERIVGVQTPRSQRPVIFGEVVLGYWGPNSGGHAPCPGDEQDSRGFVTIPAYSGGAWYGSVAALRQLPSETDFDCVTIAARYQDHGGRTRRVVVHTKGDEMLKAVLNRILNTHCQTFNPTDASPPTPAPQEVVDAHYRRKRPKRRRPTKLVVKPHTGTIQTFNSTPLYDLP
jgi:hypothetical protein